LRRAAAETSPGDGWLQRRSGQIILEARGVPASRKPKTSTITAVAKFAVTPALELKSHNTAVMAGIGGALLPARFIWTTKRTLLMIGTGAVTLFHAAKSAAIFMCNGEMLSSFI
jgi:hypothetical protein